MIRAYLYALDPTPDQERAFRSHCGAQRYAYNFGIELARRIRAQRAAEYTYGLRGAELTPCSAYDLRKAWNQAKHERAPWWAENSKEAYSSGLANAATAFGNYGDSWAGKRRGLKIRHPRFKGRRARLTCRFTTGAFGLGTDRRHIRLPVIGTVRTHETTRQLARHVDAGTARMLSATLSFQRGRWHVSFGVELPDRAPAPRTDGRVVGVDLGIKSLAGATMVVASRWYPSSKTCSVCGAVRAKLTLTEREFHCQSCGTRLDRDFNAALNLAALADRVVQGELRPDGKQPAGNPCKTTLGGDGYRHGKAAVGSQRHQRELVAR